MARTKKVEIWARFEKAGIEIYMETARNAEAAEIAIRAMNNRNKNDLAEGYGFPMGVPQYFVRPNGALQELGQIVKIA